MALEALSVLAGEGYHQFVPNTPRDLRAARRCYDHLAGTLGVTLYDRYTTLGWLSRPGQDASCELTSEGESGFAALGVDVATARALRRRFAFACVDWSERRPHLAGALGAAVLSVALQRKWIVQDLDSRIVRDTAKGKRELAARLGDLPV